VRKDLLQSTQPRLKSDLDEASSWVGDAITTTRRLTVDLSPPILQNEGLTDALNWLQRQMTELHGLEIIVEAEQAFCLEEEDLRVLLFQIVRELLFNVKKHSGSNQATVRLEQVEDDLVIEVLDEGYGFDVQALAMQEMGAGGFGLFSVRERLSLLGGHVEVHSNPGKGTHVVLRTPMTSSLHRS
jgi:signal transduction histidine kinase